MNATVDALDARLVVKLLAGACFGIGISSLVQPDPVSIPGLGSVSGLIVGGVALVAGAVLYVEPWRSDDAGCGCGGDCDC